MACCLAHGYFSGSEDYWDGQWLDLIRAVSHCAGFGKCVHGGFKTVWLFANFNVGEMGTLYKVIVLLGFALLTIGLGYLLVENIFRARTKLHEVITNLVVVIAILVMLPFGTNLFSQFVTAGAQDIVGNKGSGVTSIAVQPVQNNIVDSVFNLIKTLQNRLSLFYKIFLIFVR